MNNFDLLINRIVMKSNYKYNQNLKVHRDLYLLWSRELSNFQTSSFDVSTVQ